MEQGSSSSGAKKGMKRKAAPLDTSSADKTVWLVKLPQFISQRLDQADNGDVVGSLQLKRVAGSSVPQFSVDISYNGPVEEFHLTEHPGGPDVVAFSSHQDKFKVKGKVSKIYNMNPKDTPEYRRICKERRQMEANAKETLALSMEDVQNQGKAPKEVDFIPPVYAEAKRNSSGVSGVNKRQRGGNDPDSRDIRDKLLEAFKMRERLTFKELSGVCQVPDALLKEQLKVYATFYSKGVYKNYWELKTEFRS